VKQVAMKVKDGDMIKLAENGEFDVIVHWCNCKCIVGSIVEQIEKAFPGAYEADRATEACDSSKIGRLSFAKVKVKNNKWLVIVNGYTQLFAGGNINYHALRDVMKQVQRNFFGQRIGYLKMIQKIIHKELNREDFSSRLWTRGVSLLMVGL